MPSAKGEKEALQRIEKVRRGKGTSLDLSDLGLTSLPAEMGRLTNLKQLQLDHNQLTSLPPEIGRLAKLP